MAYKRHFGEIYGHPEGKRYPQREDVRLAGLHAHQQGGISGTKAQGADAIVLSGGYEDDEDYGEVIIYTGHGGQDDNGRQVDHQTLNDRGNAGLVTSERENLPVRVIRGPVKRSEHAPDTGYQYGGLYRVAYHWPKKRHDSYLVYQYLLVKIDSIFDTPDVARMFSDKFFEPDPATLIQNVPVERIPTSVDRIRRRVEVRENVKKWHDNLCQVCGNGVKLPLGLTSEAAHIRPLGRPHNGPDEEGNTLCLCPNDHVRFDHGALYIQDDFEIVDEIQKSSLGELRTQPEHVINIDHIRYHRNHWSSIP